MAPASLTRLTCSRAAAAGCLTLALALPATAGPRDDAQAFDARLTPLRLIEHVSVLVEDLTEDAERLALTRDVIQSDAEARLQKAGLEVSGDTATPATLYVQVSVLCSDRSGGCAIDVSSAVLQYVFLVQGATPPFKAKTWYTGQILLAPRALVEQQVRAIVQQQADAFAHDVMTARERTPATSPRSTSGAVLGLAQR